MVSFFTGASDEARTRYLHLGKVALYQMSYTRSDKKYYNRIAKNVKKKNKKTMGGPKDGEFYIEIGQSDDNVRLIFYLGL